MGENGGGFLRKKMLIHNNIRITKLHKDFGEVRWTVKNFIAILSCLAICSDPIYLGKFLKMVKIKILNSNGRKWGCFFEKKVFVP